MIKNTNWHLLDAKDQILGRFAVRVAHLLMGKSKPGFVRNQEMGDYVVVINAAYLKVTGKKETQKIYYHHTGYPQGLRKQTFAEIFKKNPALVIRKAVSGMLPDNRLKALWLKKLYIFPDTQHPYQDKFK